MNIFGCNVGVAVTGSFCTLAKIHKAIQELVERGARITPIFSDSVQSIDSRFGKEIGRASCRERVCMFV